MMNQTTQQANIIHRGVFGGTFDPIHFGHLRCAIEVAGVFDMPVHMIPSATPPHRVQPAASAIERLAMLELAISNQKNLNVDDREIQRDGASYMVETLQSLHDDYPGTSLVLILGCDAAQHLQSWHRWQRLFDLSKLLILNRPGYKQNLDDFLKGRRVESIDEFKQSDNGVVYEFETRLLDISASEIRKLLAIKQSVDYLLPAAVVEYIQRHQLYR